MEAPDTRARHAMLVRQVTVRTGRIVCDVEIPDPANRYSSKALARALVEARPRLPEHSCVNDQDAPFRDIMAATSVPHLLEHLVIDVQTERSDNPGAVFVGTTEWLDEQAGKARIQVSFADDLEALRALREAARILDSAVLRYRA